MILFQAKLACILRELAKFERLTVVKPLGKTSVLRMLFEDFQYRFLDGGLPVDGPARGRNDQVASPPSGVPQLVAFREGEESRTLRLAG